MQVFKKLFFAIPFLLFFYFSIYKLSFYITSPYAYFGFNISTFFDLLVGLAALALSLTMFTIFSTFAQDYKIVLPVAGIVCLAPPLYLPLNLSFLIVPGFLISFGTVYYFLDQRLRTYLAFSTNSLLIPSIKLLGTLILLVLSTAYFLTIDQQIKTNGFQIPDSLIEAALKIASPEETNVKGVRIAQIPQITPEQIEFLKKNPDLLKKYGLDSSVLDKLEGNSTQDSPTQNNSSAVKNLVKSQFENLIKPYLTYIPTILALLFFVTMQSLFSFIAVFLPLFLMLIFWILEKTNFIHFEKEMREVRKLVV